MAPASVTFQTIDLERHADLCLAFRRDSYVCSFGSDEEFVAADGGINGYVRWLRQRIAQQPRGHVHVWQSGSIIGQLEMRILDDLPATGYVNLFYLISAARGGGAGAALQEYVLEFMRSGNVGRAQLSVSPTNRRAVAYYSKHGWRDLGPSPRDSSCHLLELDVKLGKMP